MLGIMTYASDDDSDNQQQNNQGRVSPLGLFPITAISPYAKKYEGEIAKLERRLSQKKLERMQAIPLSAALGEKKNKSSDPRVIVVAQAADTQ